MNSKIRILITGETATKKEQIKYALSRANLTSEILNPNEITKTIENNLEDVFYLIFVKPTDRHLQYVTYTENKNGNPEEIRKEFETLTEKEKKEFKAFDKWLETYRSTTQKNLGCTIRVSLDYEDGEIEEIARGVCTLVHQLKNLETVIRIVGKHGTIELTDEEEPNCVIHMKDSSTTYATPQQFACLTASEDEAMADVFRAYLNVCDISS